MLSQGSKPASIADVLSQAEVISGFQRHALQFMMVKEIDSDTIVWCNSAAAEPLGVTPSDMIGKPSKMFYPDTFRDFHEDDLEVMRSGPKLNYIEQYTSEGGEKHQLVTNKWHVKTLGSSYIFIVALDLTAIMNLARSVTDHGRSYDFTGIKECRERFDELVSMLAKG